MKTRSAAASALMLLVCAVSAAADYDYGRADAAPWIDDALVWDRVPIDVSFLNHTPAGKFGHVVVRGERFVFAQTGAPARFWSCNLGGQACFGPEDDTAAYAYLSTVAQRIAALGFNHVRLHHTDNRPSSGPGGLWRHWSGPGIVDYTGGGTLGFNARALDRVDFLIARLKARGVYVYVDLFNLREFGPDDGIADFAAMRTFSKNKYAFHVDPQIRANMGAFAARLAAHRNPHTGTTWGAEPAICMATLANENDFTFYTTKQVLENETYRAKTLALAREHVAAGRLAINPELAVKFLSPDHNRFAAFTEETVYGEMITAARAAGWQALISAGNWSYRGPVSVLGKARAGDFTDNHAYQSESCFLFDDPATTRTIYAKLAGAHVAGKPFVVSEWQTGRSATKRMHLPHRATSVVAAAAIGAHQGWDGVSFFSYAQPWDQAARVGGGYDAYVDPAHMGVMPLAALLYRRDVTESPTNTVVVMDDTDTFGGRYDGWSTKKPDESGVPAAFLTSFERTKTTIAFAADFKPTATATAVRGAGHAKNFLAQPDTAETDTRELRRNWREGWQIIDTPRSQVVQGFFGERPHRTADAAFHLRGRFGVAAISSLTAEPVARGSRLLVTAMGPSHRVEGRGEHYRSQALAGTLTVRFATRPAAVALTPLFGDGRRGETTALAPAADGAITIDLLSAPTHWWLVEPRP
jgi:hypothetical protein